jgi:rhodanese-related sulfurtransferase
MEERTVTYMEPEELAARLRADAAEDDARELVVVDVRDDDFDYRLIRGALLIPSAEFPERVDEVLSRHSHNKDIVFHCYLSQVGARARAK